MPIRQQPSRGMHAQPSCAAFFGDPHTKCTFINRAKTLSAGPQRGCAFCLTQTMPTPYVGGAIQKPVDGQHQTLSPVLVREETFAPPTPACTRLRCWRMMQMMAMAHSRPTTSTATTPKMIARMKPVFSSSFGAGGGGRLPVPTKGALKTLRLDTPCERKKLFAIAVVPIVCRSELRAACCCEADCTGMTAVMRTDASSTRSTASSGTLVSPAASTSTWRMSALTSSVKSSTEPATTITTLTTSSTYPVPPVITRSRDVASVGLPTTGVRSVTDARAAVPNAAAKRLLTSSGSSVLTLPRTATEPGALSMET
mmetsp:Transcript_22818/g.58040  ORF Transcript_22818/g.58040 Transcript_22818/m.58040 type:complete len:312 (+) Transcript_22818:329-1264(+)